MGEGLPTMAELLRMGPSGPFPHDSEHRWFSHDDGHFRVLDMPTYVEQLVGFGTPDHVARDMSRRLTAQGAERVVWAHADGGRRGHVHSSWDVRVIHTTQPALAVLRDEMGIHGSPLGTTPIAALADASDVVVAFTQPVPEHKLQLPSRFGPGWSRRLGLPARLHNHMTRSAFVALALGQVGATVVVSGKLLPQVEYGARTLVDVIRRDVGALGGEL